MRSTETLRLLSAVDFDDAVLVDVLENMRRIHQDADRAGGGHDEEDVQLQSIDDHRHVLPVLASLDGRLLDIKNMAKLSLQYLPECTNPHCAGARQ